MESKHKKPPSEAAPRRSPSERGPGSGVESVWDYPRPPRLEPCRERLRVVFDGRIIAETTGGFRVLETSHPPVYYFPPDHVALDCLEATRRHSWCEWKGRAEYLDVVVRRRVQAAAWRYLEPQAEFAEIRDFLAFYAHLMDACFVGDERAEPQPGRFYGGWITSKVVGPFKGGPGTSGW